MVKEEKELLLKDLCARLPYGVKAYVKNWSKFERRWFEGVYTIESIDPSLNNIFVSANLGSVEIILGYDDYEIKPYLFPLSSMTEEQKEEFYKFFEEGITESANETRQWLRTKRADETRRPITIAYVMVHELVIDWLNKNHFDYRGLISKGLAIDCTNLNIYM